MIPVPGMTMRAPKVLLMVKVQAATRPSRSAAVMWVVLAPSPWRMPGPQVWVRAMSMRARRSAAYSLLVSRATGTWTKSGSPEASARSAKAIFSASAIRCTRSGEPKPMARTSNASRMFNIWVMCTPEAAGGGGAMISQPR